MYICLKCTQFLKINAGNSLSAPNNLEQYICKDKPKYNERMLQ